MAWTLIRTWTMTPLNFTYKMHFRLKMRENQEFPVDFVGTFLKYNASVATIEHKMNGTVTIINVG